MTFFRKFLSRDVGATGQSRETATKETSTSGRQSAQDELKKLLKGYMSTDEDIASTKLQKALDKATRRELIEVLKEKDESANTALHHAADKGHINTLQSLLRELTRQESFAVLRQQNGNGETTLHRATANAKLTAINQILKSVDQPFELVKLEDNHKSTALHYAVRNGDDALCKPILGSLVREEHYNVVAICNNKGFNVVHEATIQNNIDILRSILAALQQDQKAELLTQRDNDGNTAMHHAMNLKGTDILQYILNAISQKQACDLTGIQNHKGNTPMHFAAADKLAIILQHLTPNHRLLTLGIQNMEGNTVTAVAAETGNTDVLNAAMGSLEKVEKCYELLKIQNKRGYNALHLAASKGHSKVIDCSALNVSEQDFRTLVHTMDTEDNTPLHLALASGYEEVLAAITKHKGAAEDKITKSAPTPSELKASTRDEMDEGSETTHKLLKDLSEQLAHQGQQMAQLQEESQGVCKGSEQMRQILMKVEESTTSLHELNHTQRDAGEEMRDELRNLRSEMDHMKTSTYQTQDSQKEMQAFVRKIEESVTNQTAGLASLQKDVAQLNQDQQESNSMMMRFVAGERERLPEPGTEMALLKLATRTEVERMRELRDVKPEMEGISTSSSQIQKEVDEPVVTRQAQINMPSATSTLTSATGSDQEGSQNLREGSDHLTELIGADEATITEVSSLSQPEEIQRSGETTPEEPSSIDLEIGRILDRVEAGHHVLIEDPDDSTHIYIIGVYVEQALADFEALTSQPDFQELKIVPHNVDAIRNGLPQYAKRLMPFTLERKVQVNAQGRAERTTNHPKCQLIVTATHVNSSSTAVGSDFEPGYYGVTVAHAFLTRSQTERLLDSEQYDESIRMEMLEETWNSQWSLRAQTADNRGLLQMVRPPFLDYREYSLNKDDFLQDIAVFQVSERQLREDGWRDTDAATGEEKLLSFNNGSQTYKVGGLFPIKSHDDIISLCGKKVLVAFAEGVLTVPPRQVPRRGVASEMQLGLHITFCIKPPHKLEEGHSGHMVYVVDKDHTTVYIAGMLTGYLDKFEEISGKRIYQAVAAGEGLRRVEQKFPTKIRNIEMLKSMLANCTASNLVDQLQDGPQIH